MIYNHCEICRDFTYLDDLMRVTRLLIHTARGYRAGGVLHKNDILSAVLSRSVVSVDDTKKVQPLEFSLLYQYLAWHIGHPKLHAKVVGRCACYLIRSQASTSSDRLPTAGRCAQRAAHHFAPPVLRQLEQSRSPSCRSTICAG